MVDKKTGLKPKAKAKPVKKPKRATQKPASTLTVKGTSAKVQPETVREKPVKKLAKAGKRSPKALKAEEAEKAKVQRLASEKVPGAPKTAAKPPKTRLERAGKRYRDTAGQIDKTKTY